MGIEKLSSQAIEALSSAKKSIDTEKLTKKTAQAFDQIKAEKVLNSLDAMSVSAKTGVVKHVTPSNFDTSQIKKFSDSNKNIEFNLPKDAFKGIEEKIEQAGPKAKKIIEEFRNQTKNVK